MKALAVFPASREAKVVERDPPRVHHPDDVLLRTLDVGICGTDREICAFDYGDTPPGAHHLIVGHEALAEDVQTGPDVQDLQPGDLVVPTVRRPCPHRNCRACRARHQDFLHTGDFTERGIKAAHGHLAGYVVERQSNLAPCHRSSTPSPCSPSR
jgi:threonine dehydrogenase-like Zn-dependent dehydrogenase